MGLDERLRRVVDQLAYTIDEVRTLAPIIGRVPEPVLASRPIDGEPSVVDLFAAVARRDSALVLSLRRGELVVPSPDAVESEEAATSVLAQIETARRDLLGAVGEYVAVHGVSRELLSVLFDVARRDADTFRSIGFRLHSSPVTGG